MYATQTDSKLQTQSQFSSVTGGPTDSKHVTQTSGFRSQQDSRYLEGGQSKYSSSS